MMNEITTGSVKVCELATHKNDLRLIQFLLYPHDVVRSAGILVLLEIGGDCGERDGRWRRERRLRHLGREVIQHLRKEGECRSDGVFLVSDNHG